MRGTSCLLCTGRDPKPGWLVRPDSLWGEAVSTALPVVREDLMQSAATAAQVFVQWREVRPEVLACARSPHEEP